MQRIRGIAFDLEGPIVNFESHHFSSHIEAARRVFGETISYEWIIEKVPNAIGGGDRNIARFIALNLGSAEQESELLKVKRLVFETRLLDKPIEARKGAIRAFTWFRKKGYRVAIGSNTPRDAAMRYLHSVGIDGATPTVLAEDVAQPKPWPDVYLKTAVIMGIDPSEQLVIDDSHTGLEAAHRAGSPRIATPLHRTQSAMERVVLQHPLRIIYEWDEVQLDRLMQNIERELSR